MVLWDGASWRAEARRTRSILSMGTTWCRWRCRWRRTVVVVVGRGPRVDGTHVARRWRRRAAASPWSVKSSAANGLTSSAPCDRWGGDGRPPGPGEEMGRIDGGTGFGWVLTNAVGASRGGARLLARLLARQLACVVPKVIPPVGTSAKRGPSSRGLPHSPRPRRRWLASLPF